MENTPKVGKLIEGNAYRDAIHVAVAPVVAACPIRPGSHVWMTPEGLASWGNREDGNTIGIADPFLTEEIQKGQSFYLFLYPGTITSLRHMWSHPAFATKVPIVIKEVTEEPKDTVAQNWLDKQALKGGYDSGADLRNVK